MKRVRYFLLFSMLLVLFGCPERKQIPAPKPPEPQTVEQKKDGTAFLIYSPSTKIAYDWMDVVEILKGSAPLVGPTPYFFRMLA